MESRRFPAFAVGISVYTLATILWGYFLRISESGDGCGTDWPLCHGAMVPAEAAFPTWVEFIHRASSGMVLVLVAALALAAWRSFPRGHALRVGAGLALLFTVTESLFGALLVVFGLVAEDISTARILIRPLHVTNTFMLMAALAFTAWAAVRGVSARPERRWPNRATGLALLGTLALAWTGSWTGLASTAFPAASVGEGVGQYLSAEHFLIYLRTIHPLVAVGVVTYLVRFALRLRAENAAGPLRSLASVAGVLAVIQLLMGGATILLLQPAWMRLLHLALADLLWVAVVLVAAEQAFRSRAGSSQRAEVAVVAD
jgi:heme A synthase